MAHFFEHGRWGSPVESGIEGQSLTAEDQLFILMQAALYLTAIRGFAVPEARTCYERAESLCHLLNRPVQYAAMTIHHIGSANQLTQELGDSVTAVPVPGGPASKAWSTDGDGSNAIFANCVNPEAAWQWISYLSSEPANVAFNKLAGQMTVTTSGAKDWNLHPKRFVDATTQSLATPRALPLVEQTADFVRTIWPQTNQEELLGQAARRC
jgi:hypothetical protein